MIVVERVSSCIELYHARSSVQGVEYQYFSNTRLGALESVLQEVFR